MPFIFDKDGNPVDGRKLSQMYAGLIGSINWLANYSVKKEDEVNALRARIEELEKAGQDLYVCVEFEADPLLKDVAMQNWKKVMGK